MAFRILASGLRLQYLTLERAFVLLPTEKDERPEVAPVIFLSGYIRKISSHFVSEGVLSCCHHYRQVVQQLY